MKITYEIRKVIPEEHQILVRFTSDTVPLSEMVSAWENDGVTPKAFRTDYLITLPVPVPQGDALDNYIMSFCPVNWFRLKGQIHDPNVDTQIHIPVGTTKTLNL